MKHHGKRKRSYNSIKRNKREKIENLRNKSKILERESNFAEVAKINYSEIPSLEKEVVNIDEKIKWNKKFLKIM